MIQLTLTFNNADYIYIRFSGTLQEAKKHYLNSTFTDIQGNKIVCVTVDLYEG